LSVGFDGVVELRLYPVITNLPGSGTVLRMGLFLCVAASAMLRESLAQLTGIPWRSISMKIAFQFVAALVPLIPFYQTAVAVEKPSDLIVGRWRDRAEPKDAVIEFLKEGAGTITEATPKETSQAEISWRMRSTYGNAGIVSIEYKVPNSKEAKPLPKEAKPMTWLIVFDGKNAFIMQPIANKIVYMDRQESPTAKTDENAP
jgi:hypothetical protein